MSDKHEKIACCWFRKSKAGDNCPTTIVTLIANFTPVIKRLHILTQHRYSQAWKKNRKLWRIEYPENAKKIDTSDVEVTELGSMDDVSGLGKTHTHKKKTKKQKLETRTRAHSPK